MRLGVVSDVHGNLQALDAVLAALAAVGVDAHICLGDLVGYGPRPDACIERIAALGAICVAGNHDLVAIGGEGLERCGPLARQTLEWTREHLDGASRRFLDALPLEARLHGVLLTHGAIGDPWRYISTQDDAEAELRELARRGGEQWLLVGHTHHPLTVTVDGRRLVNPGAVGQSREREALARYAVIDLDAGDVQLRATRYDERACRRELRRAGLPADACHPTRGGLRARLRRRVRQAV